MSEGVATPADNPGGATAVQKPMTAASKKQQRETEGMIEKIKKRLRAAAYDNGKVNWEALFRYYDKDNSGVIDYQEFKAAIRKSAKITTQQLSDRDMLALFSYVDADDSGTVHYETEFIPWLEPNQPAAAISLPAAERKQNLTKMVRKHIISKNQQDNTEAVIEKIKKRLRAAAYDNGKVNWEALFRYYDKDNSGVIDYEEFKAAIRKSAKITAKQLNDRDMLAIFNYVDADGSGTVHYETEFLPWLRPEGGRLTPEPATVVSTVQKHANVASKKQQQHTEAMIEEIKHRLRAAAYDNGKVNWEALFRYYDKDNSGLIDYREFKAAIRKSAKITAQQLNDRDMLALFRYVDADGSGTVHYETEFMPWLEPEWTVAVSEPTVVADNDPLSLKELPTNLWSADAAGLGDTGMVGGLMPDSATYEVELLLMQERLLGEQSKWWTDRAENELIVKRALEVELNSQQLLFAAELEAADPELDAVYAEAHAAKLQEEKYLREGSALKAEIAMYRGREMALRRMVEQMRHFGQLKASLGSAMPSPMTAQQRPTPVAA